MRFSAALWTESIGGGRGEKATLILFLKFVQLLGFLDSRKNLML